MADEPIEGPDSLGPIGEEGIQGDPGGQVEGPSMDKVLASLAAMQESQAALTASLTPTLEPAPAPTPTPAAPPVPEGRITRQQYDELAAYAADQRRRAERLALATEFDLSAQDLEGDFDSPADMRRHAEVLALRQHLATLEQRLEEAQQAREETPPSVPPADTGGPTGSEDTTDAEALRRKYDEARALGRTREGRRALLAAIYNDPSKRQPVFQR